MLRLPADWNLRIDIVRETFKDTDYEYSYMTISKKYVTLIFVNTENKEQIKTFKVTYEEIGNNKNKMTEFQKERKTIDGINANKIELLQEILNVSISIPKNKNKFLMKLTEKN